jgi:hypothetical protein
VNGYDTEIHRWLIAQTEAEGITVIIDPTLTLPVLSNRSERTVWIKPGMSLEAFHWALARTQLHQVFGLEPKGAVDADDPSLPPKRRALQLITGGAR